MPGVEPRRDAGAATASASHARAARSRSQSSCWAAALRPAVATVLCALWIALPFAILLGYSWARWSIVIDRAMIIVLPPLYLLAARSITYLAPRAGGQLAATALLLALAGARWASSDGYRELGVRQDYRGATAALGAAPANRDDALTVALVVAPAGTPLLSYYLEREHPAPRIDVVVHADGGLRELAAALRERAPREVVVFCQLPRLLERTTALIESRYDLAERRPFGGRLEVRRYVARGSSAPL